MLAKVASCGPEDAERAVAVARRVFEKGSWSAQSPVQRKRVLQRFAALMHEHREELALLETLDMGKPIGDALKVDVSASVRCMNWTAEAIDNEVKASSGQ